VEDLELKNILIGSPDALGRYPNNGTNVGVFMQGCADCWVKNIKLTNLGRYGVDLYFDCFRCEVRDSWFYGGLNRYDPDHSYAVRVTGSSFNRIENNIYQEVLTGNMPSSAVGNVFAYNFAYNCGRTNSPGWCWVTDWTHGGHNAFNLFEGNVMVGIKWDYILGSNSHNTAFRNRLTGKQDVQETTMAIGAIITEVANHYTNNVGNVLGTEGWHDTYEVLNLNNNDYTGYRPIFATGVPDKDVNSDPGAFLTAFRHMNYDFFTHTTKLCTDPGEPGDQGSDCSTTLPDSLYLTGKPSWFGSVPFPPIGPDVSGYSNKIPAQLRFETLK
jgi:hypothetical protein